MTHRFFGFGSLVNTRTHNNLDMRNDVITGWRRIWRKTHLRDIAFLSAEPVTGGEVWGLSAAVPNQDWTALDAREAGYARINLTPDTALYSVQKDNFDHSTRGVILLSYLDVVIQGYEDRFGPAGIAHFFDTTDGWDVDVIDDRTAPQYPRAQDVPTDLQRMVDQHLAAKM